MHKFSTLHARFIIASIILEKVEETGVVTTDDIERDAIRESLSVQINDFWLEAIDIEVLNSVNDAVNEARNHYDRMVCYTDVRVAIDDAVLKIRKRAS